MSNVAVPPEVTLVYREVGGKNATHIFTAPHFRGFHIGSSELSEAFAQVENALSEHISRLSKQHVKYHLQLSFQDFERRLSADGIEANFVVAKQAEAARAR